VRETDDGRCHRLYFGEQKRMDKIAPEEKIKESFKVEKQVKIYPPEK
jgi:hypothetical protein